MKRLLLSLLLAALPCASAAPALQVHNIAGDFAAFWDATQTLPPDQRVAAFKQQIAPLFPDFYGVARYGGDRTQDEQDAIIARALEHYGPQRQLYLDKVAGFGQALPRHTASFMQAFPDFQQTVDIWLLHSLGEMDGGPRDLHGRQYLIFGADVMTSAHGDSDEAAFFHHELFHIYQQAVSPACEGQGMWQPLWREGLATYVSKQLNPSANDKEMLLDFPTGSVAFTRAHLYASLANLEPALEQHGEQYHTALFRMKGDQSGLAARRGYYLGYLVAQEIGRTRSLRQLAALNCADAHKLVVEAVRKLKEAAAPR